MRRHLWMNVTGPSSHARASAGRWLCGIALVWGAAASVSAQQPQLGQGLNPPPEKATNRGAPGRAKAPVPTEEPHELRYRFPEAGVVAPTSPATISVAVAGAEEIDRGERQAAIRYKGEARLSVTAEEAASESAPEGATDVWPRLVRFSLDCEAGKGSYLYGFDSNGLSITRNGFTTSYDMLDPYYGSWTVASLTERPGQIRMKNGALLEAPTAPPLLEAVRSEWVTQSLGMLMPPLPGSPVKVGQSWTAGAPIIISSFARPQLVRIEVKFVSYNPYTKVAEITWSGDITALSLRPSDGVSHIGRDSVAKGLARGRLLLEIETGRVMHSTAAVNAHIERMSKPESDVDVQFSFTLSAVAGERSDSDDPLDDDEVPDDDDDDDVFLGQGGGE